MTSLDALLALDAASVARVPLRMLRVAHANISISTVLPWVYLLVFLCLELALFLLYTDSDIDTSQYLWAHICSTSVSAMTGVCWARLAARDEGRRDRLVMVIQLAAWAILVGPFGVAIAAMFLIPPTVTGTQAPAATPVPAADADYVEISKAELLHGGLLDGRLRITRAHKIRPILDVILEGTTLEKLDALSLISKRYVPALAVALKQALEDKEASVRVLAATVMAQMNNGFTKRIGVLQASAQAEPGCAGHWTALGQAHMDYARSGLLEASRADAELTQSRTAVSRSQRPGVRVAGQADE